jgi:protein TonB
MTIEDYPAEALRNGWEGDVRVDLTIGVAGRVTNCRVLQSSGHSVLDDATCRIFTARARFRPATDPSGKPIEDHFQTHINWQLN